MWASLSQPWQAALELAWEAFCSGTNPIGAVVAHEDGRILARGRNRIMNMDAPDGQFYNNKLAHAELNVLLSLNLDDLDYDEYKHVALYSTMEPCPLCMGAFYMSAVKTLHFAARDPWSGSTNLLGTTPYLSRKPVRLFPPFDPDLESALVAMSIVSRINRDGEETLQDRVVGSVREVFPGQVELGAALYRSQKFAQLTEERASAASLRISSISGLVTAHSLRKETLTWTSQNQKGFNTKGTKVTKEDLKTFVSFVSFVLKNPCTKNKLSTRQFLKVLSETDL
jgi:tRNA(Arg) A34 adenosine deaminase TadA